LLLLAGRLAAAEPAYTRGPLIDFNLEAGVAPASVNAFVEAANSRTKPPITHLVSEDANGVRTNAVKGSYTWQDGLTILLKNTSLIMERGEATGVLIIKKAPQVTAPLRRKPLRRPAATPVARDEVLVVGTNILESVFASATYSEADRPHIPREDFTTIRDFLSNGLTQNFGGVISEDTRGSGGAATSNLSSAIALNLRGLGAESTLPLLNGRRLAPGGSEARFTDVSNIPVAAIESVHVMMDTGSAQYGADAVAGVVNFETRKIYDGPETSVSLGAADGGIGEMIASQVLGTRWTGGSLLLIGEYYDRDPLPAATRSQARSDLTPLGGDNFNDQYGNPGNILHNGAVAAIPSRQNGTTLSAANFDTASVNLYDKFDGSDLIDGQRRVSAFSHVRQEINDATDVYAELLLVRRETRGRSTGLKSTFVVPSSNAFYINPWGGDDPLLVLYNFFGDLGAVLNSNKINVINTSVGASRALGSGWRLRGSLSQSEENQRQVLRNLVNQTALHEALADSNPHTAFNAFGDGSHTNPATLEKLRSSSHFVSESRYQQGNITLEGLILARGPAVALVSVGADYRQQLFETSAISENLTTHETSLQRRMWAGFGELRFKLNAEDRLNDSAELLNLSLSHRREDYSDFSRSKVDAKELDLVVSPFAQFHLRGTWTKTFKPPSLGDLSESHNMSFLMVLPNASAPMGDLSMIWWGQNAELDAERGRSISFGASWGSPDEPGVWLSLKYFDKTLANRIENIGLSSDLLTSPNYAALVTLNPTPEQMLAVCSRSTYVGSSEECAASQATAIVDLRLRNSSALHTNGFDFDARYSVATGIGHFALDLQGTQIQHYTLVAANGTPPLELRDTPGNPLALRMRGGISYRNAGAFTRIFANYADSYVDTNSTPRRHVGSWLTFDARIGYDFGERPGMMFDRLTASLSAENVLDEPPPFLNNPLGLAYDPDNADLLGRLVMFSFRKEW